MGQFTGIGAALGAAILVIAAAPPAAPSGGGVGRVMAQFQRQHTEAACSVASIANVINAMVSPERPSISPQALLGVVGDGDWVAATDHGGDGISFAQLQLYLRQSLDRLGLADARVEAFRPFAADGDALLRLRQLLAARQPADMVLASFDQGWLLGQASVGHVSPLGDYDAGSGRVEILDVDPETPSPYWVRDQDLLAAMTRPDSDDPSGDGLIFIRPSP